MHRVLAVCLTVSMLLCGPVSAQQPLPQNPHAPRRLESSLPASIAGSWVVLPFPAGSLTLAPHQNDALAGTFDRGGGPTPCDGQWRGSKFFLLCGIDGGSAFFSGVALQDSAANRYLIGKEYYCVFGVAANAAPTCQAFELTGSPAS